MDFEHSSKVTDLQGRLTAFMEDHIYPNERLWHDQINAGDRWQPAPIIEQLKPLARSAGLSPGAGVFQAIPQRPAPARAWGSSRTR